MTSALKVVASASAPAAPYPPDTRAKGWRFELDYERIEQSDTWVLAEPQMRPWLLMLWLTAWKQAPCGSLPAHDELIAARIGMERRTFAAHRDILMRGWWLASDGRLYHPTITEQVLALVGLRTKNAGKVRKHREEKKNQQLADECNRLQQGYSPDTNWSVTTPEPEPEPEPEPLKLQTTSVANPAVSPPLARCPQAEIVALWGEVLPECRQPAKWDGVRAVNLASRWREDECRQSLDWWRKLFEYIDGVDFLMGRTKPSAGHVPFRLGLDWLVQKSNFLKVIEGAYDNA
jgi:hypothetical protein